jgi:capsular polysaccharide export protein
MPPCLAVADEVHTLTSLVGFEGLLRGKKVVVYGRPFYSGWGLTTDRHTVARRTQALTLDELVGGTLILYPRNLNRQTWRFTTPESTIRQLIDERARSSIAGSVKVAWPRRQLHKLIGAYRGVMQAR